MNTQPQMREDAIAEARRLVAELERNAAEMSKATAATDLAEGERLVAAALDSAQRLLAELQNSSTTKTP